MTEPLWRSRPSAFEILPASMPAAEERAPGVWVSEGLSNAYCVPTDDGRLVVNTGMGFEAPVHKRNFDALDDRPVHTIVLTQGHVDHVGGIDHLRGEDTVVIAQAGNVAHQADDARIDRYRIDRSDFAFGQTVLDGIRAISEEFGSLPAQAVAEPTLMFDDHHALSLGGVDVELLSTPGGETADSLVVWLPETRVALVGNLFSALIGHIPNLVTLRGDRLRDPLRFVESVERVLELDAEVLLPGHHGPVEGADHIRRELTRVRDATLHVHDETVAAMNAGRTLWEAMADITLPDHLAVGEGYGKVAWDVRATWELYAGWFKHESTTELYGSPRSSVDADVVDLVGAEALVARARERLDDGDPIAAVHLAEIVGPADEAARSVLLDAHRRLREGEGNFWLASWLETRIDELAQGENP